MDFIHKHLTRLLHAPHRWFFALLASPIHFAETHYKKRYRLTFVHAKKLFAFDLCLIGSIFILIIAAVSWFAYDPTVVKLVDLSIQPSTPTERTRSGEHLTYLIEYKNRSKTKLNNAKLTLRLPATFLIESASPEELFDRNAKTFSLPDLAPGSSGRASLTGLFYGNVGQEYHILTTFSYQQEKRKDSEQKLTNAITVLRDSVLRLELEAPATILSHGAVPIVITLKNNGNLPLANIKLPFAPSENFVFETNADPEKGLLENNVWRVDELAAGEEVKLRANLIARVDESATQALIILTPIINVQNQNLTQMPVQHTLQVIQPKVKLEAVWTDNITQAKPGETIELALNIKNNGVTELNNLTVKLPVPAEIIDTGRLSILNAGKYSSQVLAITSAFSANLKNLKPGNTSLLTINVPIRSQIVSGTDVTLALEPKLIAEVPQVAGAKYEISAASPAINIGTSLSLTAESRYYTAEGDQLGRGPLPPRAGEETKYWAIINIKNTTSKVTGLNFSAELPAHTVWTGRSSVTHGSDIFFNPANRAASWSANSLNPHETAGLYMELSFTPVAGQIGTTPILLQNFKIKAKDSFTGFDINRTAPDIDISLPQDNIGKQKGVIVQ